MISVLLEGLVQNQIYEVLLVGNTNVCLCHWNIEISMDIKFDAKFGRISHYLQLIKYLPRPPNISSIYVFI